MPRVADDDKERKDLKRLSGSVSQNEAGFPGVPTFGGTVMSCPLSAVRLRSISKKALLSFTKCGSHPVNPMLVMIVGAKYPKAFNELVMKKYWMAKIQNMGAVMVAIKSSLSKCLSVPLGANSPIRRTAQSRSSSLSHLAVLSTILVSVHAAYDQGEQDAH